MSKKITEGLNAQQRSVPQLPAQAKARHISVLGAKKDPKHPFSGYMVGSDESVETDEKPVEEANPNQQASLYNPNGKTYRGQPMPELDTDDIMMRRERGEYDPVVTVDPDNEIEKAETNIDRNRLKDLIRDSMSNLDPRSKEVLNLIFWHNQTLAQVANTMGLSPERIRQIEAGALRKLRHPSRADRLKNYVDPNFKPRASHLEKPVSIDNEIKVLSNPDAPKVDPKYAEGFKDALSGLDLSRRSWGGYTNNQQYDAGYAAGKRKLKSSKVKESIFNESFEDIDQHIKEEWNRERTGDWNGYWEVEMKNRPFYRAKLKAPNADVAVDLLRRRGVSGFKDATDDELNVQPGTHKNRDLEEDRTQPVNEGWNDFTVDGYRYEPWEENEFDGDNSKIHHSVRTPDGKIVSVDWTPYEYLEPEDLKAWIDLGMPKRVGIGPLNKATLHDLENRKVDETSFQDAGKIAGGVGGAALGSLAGPEGTIAGGALGAAAGSAAGRWADKKIDNHINNMDEAVGTLYFFDVNKTTGSFTDQQLRALGLQQSKSGKWYTNNAQSAQTIAKRLNVQARPWNPAVRESNPAAEWPEFGNDRELNEFAPSPGYGGNSGGDGGFPRKPQQFKKGDVVWIAPNPPKYRAHFPNNCPAIVMYSYESKYGGEGTVYVDVDLTDPELSDADRKYYTDKAREEANSPHEYGLLVLAKDDVGESAWFPEGDLTLIPKGTDPAVLCSKGNAAPFESLPAKAKQALSKALGALGAPGLAEAANPAQQAAIAIAIKKKNKAAAQKAVKEDITQEDVISKLKAKLGDYLSDIGQKIKNDPALKDKLAAKPKDTMGPAVKTVTTDDGQTISIHGNEDDGFRISIKNKPASAKFKTVDEATMACNMFNARRKNHPINTDYVDEL